MIIDKISIIRTIPIKAFLANINSPIKRPLYGTTFPNHRTFFQRVPNVVSFSSLVNSPFMGHYCSLNFQKKRCPETTYLEPNINFRRPCRPSNSFLQTLDYFHSQLMLVHWNIRMFHPCTVKQFKCYILFPSRQSD